MSFSDALGASFEITGFIFVGLLLLGLVSMIWRRPPKRSWRERLPRIARYCAVRAVLALTIGFSLLVITLAALTLNTHRPPADTTPVVRALQPTGNAVLTLEMNECAEPVTGRIFAPPLARRDRDGGRAFVRVYSDADGFQRVKLDRAGRGEFQLSDPTSRKGLLSCFMQLPVVGGVRGDSTVKLRLSEGLEVNTTESAPAPTGYFSGSWLWRCPAGQTCPALASVEFEFEDGAKQVIVLILASIFGAIIAILVTEVGIAAVRRRLLPPSED